jgi:hypothetical protein
MEQIATKLHADRFTLRSGHAPGADQAFERGAGHRAELYLPWPGFEDSTPIKARTVVSSPTREAIDLSASHHPTWDGLKRGAKQLHGRNAHQVLGLYLDSPALLVVCWTPDALGGGGTGQAIRIAKAHGVDVHDLANDVTRGKWERWAAV